MQGLFRVEIQTLELKLGHIIQKHTNTLRLAVLLDTGNVGPEPTVHLRPGHVLIAVLLWMIEVKNVLQETVSLLQIRNTHVAKKCRSLKC